MDLDFELYKGKKYSSLLKDVVVNSEQKKDQIDILVSDLRSMIKTANDAIVVVPLIKDYLDVSVRNDEQLVKLAAVVQRIISSQSQGDDGNMGMLLSEDERKQLMGEVDKITKEINSMNASDYPVWSFDGSSTKQASGSASDCLLKPVAIYPDPTRINGFLVITEVLDSDRSAHESNARATIDD